MVALGEACVVALGGRHAWLVQGGMRGCSGGACMVAPRGVHGCSGGHAWFLWGGIRGCSGGGHAWLLPGGHAWDTMRYGDTINERAVRILLECILVYLLVSIFIRILFLINCACSEISKIEAGRLSSNVLF